MLRRGGVHADGKAVDAGDLPLQSLPQIGASTFAFMRRENFTLTRGGEAISTYSAAPPYRYDRTFCRHCGTALGELGSAEDSFPINANLFDRNPGLPVRFHEFVAEKPDWLVIGDSAPQFPHHPQRAG